MKRYLRAIAAGLGIGVILLGPLNLPAYASQGVCVTDTGYNVEVCTRDYHFLIGSNPTAGYATADVTSVGVNAPYRSFGIVYHYSTPGVPGGSWVVIANSGWCYSANPNPCYSTGATTDTYWGDYLIWGYSDDGGSHVFVNDLTYPPH